MPVVHYTTEINAEPDRVFALIARAEEFPLYSDPITAVTPMGNRAHHWRARLAGVTLEWDSVVTESVRPNRLAWRSLTGVQNCGSYSLERSPFGTKVEFAMEYHLPFELLEKGAAPVLDPLIERCVADVLGNMKEKLETEDRGCAYGSRDGVQ